MNKKSRRGADKGPKKKQELSKSTSLEGASRPQKNGKKKSIKNARSLSDVLGGRRTSGGRSEMSIRESYFRKDKQGSKIVGKDQNATPRKSTGLKYITSFPAKEERSDFRPEPSVDTPRRYSASTSTMVMHDSPVGKGKKRDQRSNKRPKAKKGSSASYLIQGIVKRHPDGFGFLIPHDSQHSDVYISRHSMTGVMTNDLVEVEVFKSARENKYYGEVTGIIKRAHSRLVGRYLPVDKKYGVILDDNRGWGADLRIPAQDSMDAKEGELVAVEVVQFPNDQQEFMGRVISVLGDVDEPIHDVKRMIYSHGIPEEFSLEALANAREYGGLVTESEMANREDLRDKNLITIDGVTARDFDDAVLVESTQKGFHLIVAIADVSHYVKPNSPLDAEAYERGTSTYFPNYVVPMLPEELSNELCSLKPHVPRLCFAVEVYLSKEGDIESYRFFEAVMVSKARVTYGEAQEVIDGLSVPKLSHVKDNILQAETLARVLMEKRFRDGSLDLDIPETQVVVDVSGETTDIVKSERLFAHRLIEELMLVANICAARFLDRAGIPGIYRVHETPDEENIRSLQKFLWNLGGRRLAISSGGDNSLQKGLTKALQELGNQPGLQVLHLLTLRAMSQARYSGENCGHFGLGFSHYSHFTSPIRRYPDLIAHRLIKSQIYLDYKQMEMSAEDVASASTFLSACEQRSVKAERQLISIKKSRFMTQFVGQTFDGVISSVTKFGVFVLLRQFDVDGLVKIEELGDDRFVFDEETLKLIGKRSGLVYSIGDSLRVLVSGTDSLQGRIDLTLALSEDEEGKDVREESRGQKKKQKSLKKALSSSSSGDRSKSGIDVQKRSKAKNDRGGVRKKRISGRRRKN